jgi:protein-disulfide isomerase
MKLIGAGCVALAAISLSALVAPAMSAPQRHKPVQAQDWTKTVTETADGGFKMGNPNAKIQLVEYGSLTCPHCRHFAETGVKPLIAKYVRTGKASYEYRSLILNGIDVAATLVARCGGPSHFFPMAAQLYATQQTWIGKITDAESEKLNALPQDQMFLGVAKVTGLIPMAAAHGIPAAKAETCVKDQAAADQLQQMVQAASDKGVQGTPTFFLNDKLVPAYDWGTLEPFLKDAGS